MYRFIIIAFSFFLCLLSPAISQDFTPGDTDNNGTIDIVDALNTAQYYSGLDPSPFFPQAADVNCDESVDILDALLIARYYVGLITEFPGSATPVPSSSSAQTWCDWKSGYATYTGSGYSGGAALLDPIDPDMEITALNPADYNYSGINAALAGVYLEVEGPLGTTVVYVTDLYPEGDPGALDLCPTSFDKIGDMSAGKIDIRWRGVKAPISGNVSYRIKEGSSQYWAAIQVRNHTYPVLKMEYAEGGEWIYMEKMPYNHFMATDMGPEILEIRLTDIRGEMVTDTIPPLPDGTEDAFIVQGNVQFPD
jgi:expansin